MWLVPDPFPTPGRPPSPADWARQTPTDALRLIGWETAAGGDPVRYTPDPTAPGVAAAPSSRGQEAERLVRRFPQPAAEPSVREQDERRFIHSTDLNVWPPGTGHSLSGWRGRTQTGGDSSFGRAVESEGRVKMLITAHAVTDPTDLAAGVGWERGGFVIHPSDARGGSREDRLGHFMTWPIRVGQRPATDPVEPNVDLAVVTLDERFANAVRRRQGVVRVVLWDGWAIDAPPASRPDNVPVRAPVGPIDTAWVHDNLRPLGLSELGSLTPCGRNRCQVNLQTVFPWEPGKDRESRRLTIEFRRWRGRLLVSVVGTLGRVVGHVDPTRADIGRTALITGERSGLTTARTSAAGVMVDNLPVGGALTAAFDDWVMLEGTEWVAADGVMRARPVSLPGDSNGDVFYQDRGDPAQLLVVGMVNAGVAVKVGNRESLRTLVQPIGPCLRLSRTSLLTA